MTVESIDGDEVTVLEYDPKKKAMRRRVYKTAALQPTPKRRAIRFALG